MLRDHFGNPFPAFIPDFSGEPGPVFASGLLRQSIPVAAALSFCGTKRGGFPEAHERRGIRQSIAYSPGKVNAGDRDPPGKNVRDSAKNTKEILRTEK